MSVNTMITPAAAGTMVSRQLRQIRCTARVTAPQLELSRMRLNVTEHNCCIPCLVRKRVISDFSFGEDEWKKTEDRHHEFVTDYQHSDTTRFQNLRQDLQVKIKCWDRRRVVKTFRVELSDFL